MKAEQLPTRDQLALIEDVAALDDIRAEVDRATIHIETQLELHDGLDGEWRARAVNALALHRFTLRLIDRRLEALQGRARKAEKAAKAQAVRPAEDIHPLTREALERVAAPAPHTLETTEEVDRWLEWCGERIAAVASDRADEIGLPAIERDEAFLAATALALPELRRLRQQLQTRRGEISRALRKAEQAAVDDSRERLFIDLCRETLDRATYQAIWDRVDAVRARQAAEAPAA